ncbi:MAG: filamentous hemagglutinin N-terminal domain-containing protein [Candidatus Devosia symbiotica]|nr:filamentous hemagglutinin N-terminal domain-containing protein [Candidatus Devosia symbiotica]
MVVGGIGSISQNDDTTLIEQSSSSIVMEWQNFDTTAGETVRFAQPSSNSWALNRVLAEHVTNVDSSLFANSNVIITNSSGIHFGPNSMVDVGSLIASSSDITDSNFCAGNLIFDQLGAPDAMVSNAGTISVCDSGLAALVAPPGGVGEDSSLIQAELGTVILGAGQVHTIDFYGNGLIKFVITKPTDATSKQADGSDGDTLVSNSGNVAADGGTIIMTASQATHILDTAINISGVAQANTVGTRGGMIVFGGGSGRSAFPAGLAPRPVRLRPRSRQSPPFAAAAFTSPGRRWRSPTGPRLMYRALMAAVPCLSAAVIGARRSSTAHSERLPTQQPRQLLQAQRATLRLPMAMVAMSSSGLMIQPISTV